MRDAPHFRQMETAQSFDNVRLKSSACSFSAIVHTHNLVVGAERHRGPIYPRGQFCFYKSQHLGVCDAGKG